jgi:hypothetical protein
MKNVGKIIRCCVDATGATLDVVPTRRTVWRAVVEGGLASQAQIIYELWNVKGAPWFFDLSASPDSLGTSLTQVLS